MKYFDNLKPVIVQGKAINPTWRPLLLISTALLAVSAWSVLLLAVRVLVAGRSWLLYMVWNLFLAWLPVCLAIATWAFIRARNRLDIKVALAAMAWLAFFPNAPYMVTDLVHLQFRAPIPLWYDAVMLTSFGLAGILLGNASLRIMQQLVQTHCSNAASWVFVVTASLAAGFGVYLGRFERWNSTDLGRHPMHLLQSIGNALLHPLQNPEPWQFTLLFGGFILGAYLLNLRLWFAIHRRWHHRKTVPAEISPF